MHYNCQMTEQEETIESIQGRLNILNKGLVSEENSVQYYETLLEKTPTDTQENIGIRRMYEELKQEEILHVEKFNSLIEHWNERLKTLQTN